MQQSHKAPFCCSCGAAGSFLGRDHGAALAFPPEPSSVHLLQPRLSCLNTFRSITFTLSKSGSTQQEKGVCPGISYDLVGGG
jgi:hypothetical protein